MRNGILRRSICHPRLESMIYDSKDQIAMYTGYTKRRINKKIEKKEILCIPEEILGKEGYIIPNEFIDGGYEEQLEVIYIKLGINDYNKNNKT